MEHVLILVLVEDGLGDAKNNLLNLPLMGLNPCFSGGWSRSGLVDVFMTHYEGVLILVLVEDGLGAPPKTATPSK